MKIALLSKEFICKDCGDIPFFVSFKNRTRCYIENYKHICSWCGKENVRPTGKEEIIINGELITLVNGKEVKRRKPPIKNES
jgi:hypothetical protein